MQPQLDGMSKHYRLTNTGQSKLSLLPVHQSFERVDILPGESVDLTGFQVSTVYAHGIRVFRDCVPQRLTMIEISAAEAQAPERAEDSEESGESAAVDENPSDGSEAESEGEGEGESAPDSEDAPEGDDELKDEAPSDDGEAADQPSESKPDAVKRLKAQMKTLEKEYKDGGASLDRKNEIKEEIRGIKNSLKSLK